jgi:hypothetical protein
MKPEKCLRTGMVLKDARPTYCTLQKSYTQLVNSIFVMKCSNEISNRFKNTLNEYGVACKVL